MFYLNAIYAILLDLEGYSCYWFGHRFLSVHKLLDRLWSVNLWKALSVESVEPTPYSSTCQVSTGRTLSSNEVLLMLFKLFQEKSKSITFTATMNTAKEVSVTPTYINMEI